jgi:D-threo-aldose 1-dehydrogenase
MSALVPQRPIGADLAVSVFGFGSASIGNLYRVVPEEQARGCVEAAWDAGMRYFDTAPHYGVGLSERRLGAALADKPRADYVLSTKVGRLLVPNPHPTGSDLANAFDTPDTFTRVLDYSAAGVRRSLEESLGRLGVDRVDIVFVHDPDDFVEQTRTEALPELARMREEGIVGAIGVGMNQWQAPLHLLTQCEVALDVVMLAGPVDAARPLGCPARGGSPRARGTDRRGRAVQLRPARSRRTEPAGALRLRSGSGRVARRRPAARGTGPRIRDDSAGGRDPVPVAPPRGGERRGRTQPGGIRRVLAGLAGSGDPRGILGGGRRGPRRTVAGPGPVLIETADGWVEVAGAAAGLAEVLRLSETTLCLRSSRDRSAIPWGGPDRPHHHGARHPRAR